MKHLDKQCAVSWFELPGTSYKFLYPSNEGYYSYPGTLQASEETPRDLHVLFVVIIRETWVQINKKISYGEASPKKQAMGHAF